MKAKLWSGLDLVSIPSLDNVTELEIELENGSRIGIAILSNGIRVNQGILGLGLAVIPNASNSIIVESRY